MRKYQDNRGLQPYNQDRQMVYCNCCGRKIKTEGYENREEYMTCSKTWGYFSKEKDGQTHRFDLCESCYDRLRGRFVLPVEVIEETELI